MKLTTIPVSTHGFKEKDLILFCDRKRYFRVEEIIDTANMTVRKVSFIMNLYYRIRATLNLYMNIVWKS